MSYTKSVVLSAQGPCGKMIDASRLHDAEAALARPSAESPHSAANRARPLVWVGANTSWYVFNFRSKLVTSLQDAGYEVVACAPTDAYTDRLLKLGVNHVHLPLDNAGVNPIKDAVSLLRLARMLRQARPDVFLTYTPKLNIYGSLAAAVSRVPVIANVSGLGSGFLRGGWLASVMRVLYGTALRHARWVYFQNEDDRRIFVDEGLVTMEKTERLPGSGVDIDRFVPLQPPDAEPGTFVFLLVGRLLRDKGVHEFVAAARTVREDFPNARFVVVGFLDARNPTAIPRAQVERWCHEGVIEYVEPTENIAAQYARAHCVVLPSYREGTSRVLLEAASMGLPIITTDVPGCRDVVDDGVNGYLCRVRDPEDLASKMRAMLSLSRKHLLSMGSAGREKVVREFDERTVLARYLERIGHIVSCRSM